MPAAPDTVIRPVETVDEPRAPFPYFGGKRWSASIVWAALGDAGHYIEPFCGSCAILLARPKNHRRGLETVNDADGMLVNVWRALRDAPDEVARYCYDPPMECEYHARKATLVHGRTEFVARLEGDPSFYDPKFAGYWIYCQSLAIGSIWDIDGPWHIQDGMLVKEERTVKGGIIRKVPELFSTKGINRELPHLSSTKGINRELPRHALVRQYFRALMERLSSVRIVCGDWHRVVASRSTLFASQDTVGVFLDPPYDGKGETLYNGEATGVAKEAREWAVEAGEDPRVRIVLCGYDGEHDEVLSRGWGKAKGKGGAGYQKDKSRKEMLWLSPGSLKLVKASALF
jgi:site-specific DNA-adenine methylase